MKINNAFHRCERRFECALIVRAINTIQIPITASVMHRTAHSLRALDRRHCSFRMKPGPNSFGRSHKNMNAENASVDLLQTIKIKASSALHQT